MHISILLVSFFFSSFLVLSVNERRFKCRGVITIKNYVMTRYKYMVQLETKRIHEIRLILKRSMLGGS